MSRDEVTAFLMQNLYQIPAIIAVAAVCKLQVLAGRTDNIDGISNIEDAPFIEEMLKNPAGKIKHDALLWLRRFQ